MLQVLHACLERRDAEAPEDLEPTLFVLDLFQDGMDAGSCGRATISCTGQGAGPVF